MGWLGEQAVVAHLQANIPCALSIKRFDHDGIQQTLATNEFDIGRVDLAQFIPEQDTQLFGILCQLLITNNFQGRHGHFCCHRVTSKGRSVFARMDAHHDVIIGQHR